MFLGEGIEITSDKHFILILAPIVVTVLLPMASMALASSFLPPSPRHEGRRRWVRRLWPGCHLGESFVLRVAGGCS